MEAHEGRIAAAFTEQAATFEDARLNAAFTSGLTWLVGLVDPRPDDRVVDVAGGTGLVARALAAQVAEAIVVDVTPAMLEAGRVACGDAQHQDVKFCQGDAAALPFDDATFTLAVSRFAMHHLADPRPVVREMVRVVAPAGRVVVMDLVSGPDPVLAQRQDGIERLRDDSHVTMPVAGAVGRWLSEAGCSVLDAAQETIDRPVEAWLAQSLTPEGDRARVRETLRRDIDGGEPTGMRPFVRDGALWFHQTWETTVARRCGP